MPRIKREEENAIDNINWFTTVSGVLTDMFLVEFQIFNIESGLPGSQIFPVSGWEDVTAAPGKFSTGSYYAYDNANTQGWTPESDADLGTHRIYWRWKQFSGSSYQTGAEDFELLAQGVGAPAVTYVTVDDLRALGLPDPPFSDADILDAIILWQAVLERACRQWFYERELTIKFDGNNRDTIHLGVPIISVEHLKINGSDDALDTDLFLTYSGRSYPDDRRNPRIKLKHSSQLTSIYVAASTRGELRFLRGNQNQEISGAFGFIEPDGSTPAPIKRALLKLVAEKLTLPIYTPAGTAAPAPVSTTVAGIVLSEKTDGHAISYGTASFSDRRSGGISGITQDTEILDIIKLYRAPIGIATAASWSYFG